MSIDMIFDIKNHFVKIWKFTFTWHKSGSLTNGNGTSGITFSVHWLVGTGDDGVRFFKKM
jgi:hypothetical protein